MGGAGGPIKLYLQTRAAIFDMQGVCGTPSRLWGHVRGLVTHTCYQLRSLMQTWPPCRDRPGPLAVPGACAGHRAASVRQPAGFP